MVVTELLNKIPGVKNDKNLSDNNRNDLFPLIKCTYMKQYNVSENDWSDLQVLVANIEIKKNNKKNVKNKNSNTPYTDYDN